MHYIIYPDIVFLINMMMDYILLGTWSKVCHITTTYPRLVLASAAGAAWSLVVLFELMPTIPEILCTYFGVVYCLTGIVSGHFGVKGRLAHMAAFYAVAVVVCGFMSLAGENRLAMAAFAVVLYQGAVPLLRMTKKYVRRRNLLYTVQIKNGGETVNTCALYDTGNRLTDPYNGKPVCIVEKAIAGVLVHGQGIRLIPFKSLGRDVGLMRLIQVETMVVEHDGEKWEYENQEIAIYDGSLSGNGEYGMILNSMILR